MNKTILTLALSCLPVYAQAIFPFPGPGVFAAPVWTKMGANQIAVATSGSSTSASINTSATGTGGVAATIFAVKLSCTGSATMSQVTVNGSNIVTGGFSDSSGNTYTALPLVVTNSGLGSQGSTRWVYTLNPTTSTATTWTMQTCADTFTGLMQTAVFSSRSTPALDTSNQLLSGSTTAVNVPLPPSGSLSTSGDLILLGTAIYCVQPGSPSDNSSGGPLSWSVDVHTEATTSMDGFIAHAIYPSTPNITVTGSYSSCGGDPAGFAIAFKL